MAAGCWEQQACQGHQVKEVTSKKQDQALYLLMPLFYALLLCLHSNKATCSVNFKLLATLQSAMLTCKFCQQLFG